MPDTPIIDPQALENLRALDPDGTDNFLKEIVSIYLEDTPRRIAELEEGLASGDLQKFTRAAHSIKGSSANLGINLLREVAGRLESDARRDGLKGVGSAIEGVKAEFARAEAELRKLY